MPKPVAEDFLTRLSCLRPAHPKCMEEFRQRGPGRNARLAACGLSPLSHQMFDSLGWLSCLYNGYGLTTFTSCVFSLPQPKVSLRAAPNQTACPKPNTPSSLETFIYQLNPVDQRSIRFSQLPCPPKAYKSTNGGSNSEATPQKYISPVDKPLVDDRSSPKRNGFDAMLRPDQGPGS